jgi:hypothetical protein
MSDDQEVKKLLPQAPAQSQQADEKECTKCEVEWEGLEPPSLSLEWYWLKRMCHPSHVK